MTDTQTPNIEEMIKPVIISVFAYDKDNLSCKNLTTDFTELTTLLAEYPSVWVRVIGRFDPQVLTPLFDLFQITKQQVEHLFNYNHTAHLTVSTNLLKLSHILHYDTNYEKHQSTYFLGKNFLLSFHAEMDSSLEEVSMMLGHRQFLIRQHGPDLLLYYLLSKSVDSYLEMVRHLGDGVGMIEDALVIDPDSFDMATFFKQRRRLTALKRDIWLQRDVFFQLATTDALPDVAPLVKEDSRIALQRCAERASEVLDLMDTYIDHYRGLVDIYFSSNSNQINQVMKILTIFSAIFLPLSFLAGLWGMNFDYQASHWNMPELHTTYGYPVALCIMLFIAIGLLGVFYKVGWIGKKKCVAASPAFKELDQ